MADSNPQFVVEITVLSVENLKKPSFALFSRRLGPFFISITNPGAGTKCDEKNITVGDSLRVPIEDTFFVNRYSCIYLQLHTKRLLGRRHAQLGQCSVPAADIGAPPVGSVRHLSYKLRSKDGSKGYVTINIKVKLERYLAPSGQEIIGIPVPRHYAHRISWPKTS